MSEDKRPLLRVVAGVVLNEQGEYLLTDGVQEAEIHRILRNQLGLALRLLPQLREAASSLRGV